MATFTPGGVFCGFFLKQFMGESMKKYIEIVFVSAVGIAILNRVAFTKELING